MQTELKCIPAKEVLHFLGWRGAPIEAPLMERIAALSDEVIRSVQPRVMMRRFRVEEGGRLEETVFSPTGESIRRMLAPCHETVLLAATLGAQSERMLLRMQAKDAAQALVLDAVLSAAIEAVCDEAENDLRTKLSGEGLYLTDRFSPGYGDMPLAQTREICEVLNAAKTIGLAVSGSGIMIPRKSVTAVMGISHAPVLRRARGCAGCAMRESCPLAEKE